MNLDAIKGFKLRKTANLAALKEKKENSVWQKAPMDILDAEFVNIPAINKISEVFEDGKTQLLLIDFFAFSCTNCIRAGKVIADVYDRFKDKGLEVIAFARPEFSFEGDVGQVKEWIKRKDVKYPVVTDAKGTNWHNWNVTSWPTHYLVQADKRSGHEGEYIIAHTHVGDRNSHELYNQILKLLKLDEPRVPPMNSQGYTDVEIFLGDIFRNKNTGDSDCAKTKACKMEDPSNVDVSKADGVPWPETGKITEYGAGYCRYCRKAKALLGLAGVSYTYVDVMEFGGGPAVAGLLQKQDLLPASHKTLPIVFGEDGQFLGGFTELRANYQDVTDDAIDEATIPAPVPDDIQYKKMLSTATISIPQQADWAGGKEALVAQVDRAALHFSANLANTALASLYVVCMPPEGSSTTITSEKTSKEIHWAGRHYFQSYGSDTPSDTLYFSKGTKVYVFWLSAEPPETSEGSS